MKRTGKNTSSMPLNHDEYYHILYIYCVCLGCVYVWKYIYIISMLCFMSRAEGAQNCGGVPYFFNEKTGSSVCGAAPCELLKMLAKSTTKFQK